MCTDERGMTMIFDMKYLSLELYTDGLKRVPNHKHIQLNVVISELLCLVYVILQQVYHEVKGELY